jgi:outer membrane receptor protein involved in Fe transport
MASRVVTVLLGVLLLALPARADQGQTQAPDSTVSQPQAAGAAAAQAKPPAATPATPADQQKEKPKEKPKEGEAPRYEEQVVVTASKVEQELVNAPATVSIVSAQTLESKSNQDYASLFRSVPGVNVSQTSARDLNITSRGATGTLSTSQLAMIDGRSVYLDFFGFVGWDFLPVNFSEVKQIEIIRGPASAVWGANALNGVVNIITKTPREAPGTNVTFGVGTFDRTVKSDGAKAGTSFYTSVSHAQAINDRWAFRVSAGFFQQDAYARPVGVINPASADKTTYPLFKNSGTSQPKVDARLDYDFPDGQNKLTFAGGYGGTSGIIHTGIGPFQIQKGSNMSYGKADYSRGALRVKFFTNILDGTAPALMAIGTNGQPITFTFNTKTFDFEVSNISTIGTHHVLSYGGNVRTNNFKLSIAPGGSSRQEGGIYLQDEMFLGSQLRWLVGARLDKIDVISKAIVSPRTTLMFKPSPAHTFRVSYNQGFRAPSLVNNFLDVTILNQMDLGTLNPALAGRIYTFPLVAQGNAKTMKQQSLQAYEIGYSGTINNRASVSLAAYYNDMKDEIFFTQDGSYSSVNPAPGWPLPLVYLDAIIASGKFGAGNGLPSHYTYLNLGRVKYYGIEAGVDVLVTNGVNAFFNYSWNPDPKPNFSKDEINLPPHNRVNAGVNVNVDRFLGDVSVTYQDKAYWQDVLDIRYAGWTNSFTLVNASVGFKWAGGRIITSVKGTNILNQEVQQHVFGDVIKRALVAEVRIKL